MTRFLLILAMALSVGSCSSVDVARYADQQPALNLEHFFSQPVKAWGMFQKRSGEVVKRFEVNIVSHREGNNLILDERSNTATAHASARLPSRPGPGGWSGRRMIWRRRRANRWNTCTGVSA